MSIAIERFDGLTPTDLASYTGSLPARAFLDPFNDRSDPTTVTEPAEFSFTVPATGKVSLPFVIANDPTDLSNLTLSTGPGGAGTVYTVGFWTTALTGTNVWTRRGTGWLEFAASQAGQTVYLTCRTYQHNIDAAWFARLWNQVRKQEGQFQAELAETFTGCPLHAYIGSDDKIHIGNISAVTTLPSGFVVTDGAMGSTGTLVVSGVTIDMGLGDVLPKNVPLYAGNSGKVTYWGDSGSYKATTGQILKPVGMSLDGTHVLLNCNQHYWREQP